MHPLCCPFIKKSSASNLSRSIPPTLNHLQNNRMKGTPPETTYQVDGHIRVLCHRSGTDIVTTLACRSFDHLSSLPTIFYHVSSPPTMNHINCLGNRWTLLPWHIFIVGAFIVCHPSICCCSGIICCPFFIRYYDGDIIIFWILSIQNYKKGLTGDADGQLVGVISWWGTALGMFNCMK